MLALMHGETSHHMASLDNTEPQDVPSDFTDAIFARRLREIRTGCGMSQQQLADMMARTGNKWHRSTIGKIENGDQPVTIGQAVQLASIFGIGLKELITECLSEEEATLRNEYLMAMTAVRAAEHELNKVRAFLDAVTNDYEKARMALQASQEKADEIEFQMARRGLI